MFAVIINENESPSLLPLLFPSLSSGRWLVAASSLETANRKKENQIFFPPVIPSSDSVAAVASVAAVDRAIE